MPEPACLLRTVVRAQHRGHTVELVCRAERRPGRPLVNGSPRDPVLYIEELVILSPMPPRPAWPETTTPRADQSLHGVFIGRGSVGAPRHLSGRPMSDHGAFSYGWCEDLRPPSSPRGAGDGPSPPPPPTPPPSADTCSAPASPCSNTGIPGCSLPCRRFCRSSRTRSS